MKRLKFNNVRVSCGIDTLYYYIETDLELYRNFYDNMLISVENESLFYENFYFLGNSNGYHFFNLISDDNIPVAKIGFKSYTKQRHIKDIYIQLDGTSIYYYGLKDTISLVDEFLSIKCSLTLIEKYVSRFDLNIFSNIDFSKLDTTWLASRFRGHSDIYTYRSTTNDLETLYLGKRKNGKVVRLYNKTLEIKKNKKKSQKNKVLIDYLKKQGLVTNLQDNVIQDVIWNLELEMHRKYFKKYYDIDTVDDLLKNIYSIWDIEFSTIRILKKEKKYFKHLKSLKKDRIPELEIFTYLKSQYTKNNLDKVNHNIKKEVKGYKMKLENLFARHLRDLNQYILDNQDKNFFLDEYFEMYVEYIANFQNLDKTDYSSFDKHKHILFQDFDKMGYILKSEYLLREKFAS